MIRSHGPQKKKKKQRELALGRQVPSASNTTAESPGGVPRCWGGLLLKERERKRTLGREQLQDWTEEGGSKITIQKGPQKKKRKKLAKEILSYFSKRKGAAPYIRGTWPSKTASL